jgi:hypothetical protein
MAKNGWFRWQRTLAAKKRKKRKIGMLLIQGGWRRRTSSNPFGCGDVALRALRWLLLANNATLALEVLSNQPSPTRRIPTISEYFRLIPTSEKFTRNLAKILPRTARMARMGLM